MYVNNDWPEQAWIRTAGELREWLRRLHSAVNDGSLRQLRSANEAHPGWQAVTDISPDGPWPDLIHLCFEDVETGGRFEFSVETYHGNGGSWKIVPPR